MLTRKQAIRRARRVVIKLGSTVVAGKTGVNRRRISSLADEIAWLMGKNVEVAVVSSGAVAAGRAKLGLKERPRAIELKQAAAAVGQSSLIQMYERSLSRHGIGVGQVLMTGADLVDRRRFINARNTLQKLFEYGIVPVINENDTVSVEELKFGDNDNLAAMTTNLAGADTLVILSDVDGLFDKDPHNKGARLIPEVGCITPEVENLAGKSCSISGTGGMSSKISAAKKVSARGASCFIINGTKAGTIRALFEGADIGSYIMPCEEQLSSRRHWMAFTMRGKGKVVLDEGAAAAIVKGKKSLLPSGIKYVEGRFEPGDAVDICSEDGYIIARGLIHYGSEELERIKGRKSSEIEALLGYKYCDEVVHRDDLVVL